MDGDMDQIVDVKPRMSSLNSNYDDAAYDDGVDDHRQYTKTKIARFRAKHDIFLLKCVLARNPFAHSRHSGAAKLVNEQIAEDLNKVFQGEFVVDHRRVRERYQLILKQYLEEDVKRRSRTDTNAELQEKIQLLLECTELQKEEERAARSHGSRQPRKHGEITTASAVPIGVPISLNPTSGEDGVSSFQTTASFSASVSLDEDSNPASPPPPMKRKRRSDMNNGELVDYFQTNNNVDKSYLLYREKELELKEKELRLKERELDLREQELNWKIQQASEGDQEGKAALLSLLLKHLK